MAQFGINPDPKVSAVWRTQNIMDDPVKQSNKRGFVTFAKTGAPNTRSTQLFINYEDNSRLDPQGFAPFGEVIEGMESSTSSTPDTAAIPIRARSSNWAKPYIDRNMPKVDQH